MKRRPPPVYSPETAERRKRGNLHLRLRPEEAEELLDWAEEYGGLASLVRHLLDSRERL